ncbi:hypothetical protein [Nocardioides litoris]|nr:hypothetical protein [Nocardioides litoris]
MTTTPESPESPASPETPEHPDTVPSLDPDQPMADPQTQPAPAPEGE